VIGKWSDAGAVAKKLSEYGLAATPENLERILVASQQAGVAHRRPLRDDEFLEIARAVGVLDGE